MGRVQDSSRRRPMPARAGHWLLRAGWRWGSALLVLYLLAVVIRMIFENALIFPAPRYPQGDWAPRDFEFQDVYFSAADGVRLHGWYFEHPRPRGQLLYLHGNGDFVPNLGYFADMLRERFGVSVLIFDYRGYGRSEGRPNEAGVLADGRAARGWLAHRGNVPEDHIVLMGRSLGGAVAVDLAAESGAAGMILECTFSSMTDVAAYHFPWLPVRLCLRARFDSVAKIADYHGPLLQCHGTEDSVVPFRFGKKLFEMAVSEDKRFIPLQSVGHNDPFPSAYYAALDEFLSRVLTPTNEPGHVPPETNR